MDKEHLKTYGIDYEKGLSRCMDDHQLYMTLLSMFRQDDCFQRARNALAARDAKALFECMHELKGTSGNLELTALYALVCPLVEELRTDAADLDKIAERFAPVEEAYARALEGFALLAEEN